MSTNIPLIGPPDGWPRTADGHLIKIGMTVYSRNSHGVIRFIYTETNVCGEEVLWCRLSDDNGDDDGCVILSDIYAIEPKPKTWLDKQIELTQEKHLRPYELGRLDALLFVRDNLDKLVKHGSTS